METDRQPERDAVAGRLQDLDQVLGGVLRPSWLLRGGLRSWPTVASASPPRFGSGQWANRSPTGWCR
jgi:hypothetical protein